VIDAEVHRILAEADEMSERLLTKHREELETISRELLKREELSEAELTELIGPSIQSQQAAARKQKEEKKATIAPSGPGESDIQPVTSQEDREE
jgi:cell division protease FtsH